MYIFLILLLSKLSKLKAKKDVAQIFNNILRRQIGTRSPTVEYIANKEETIFQLINGYGS